MTRNDEPRPAGDPAVSIDFMAALERVLLARPYATPADVRRMAPELRDWADKRLAKNIVLTRLRLAARSDGGA